MPAPRFLSRARSLLPALRIAFLVIAVGLGVWFLATRWQDLTAGFRQIGLAVSTLSFAAAIVATVLTYLSWIRLLRGRSFHIPTAEAGRLFFLTQLGKYIPGAVWPFVAQAEFGRRYGLKPLRTVVIGLLTVGISLLMGGAAGLAVLPLVLPGVPGWIAVLAVIPVAVVVAVPPSVLGRLIELAGRLTRRPLELEGVARRDVAVAAVWALLAWLAFGVHLRLLLTARPDLASFGVAVGCYALAWIVGFLLFFLPAGFVGREGALIALLVASGTVGTGQAAAAAIVSRGLVTLADIVLAGLAVLVHLVVTRVRRA